MLNRLIKIGSLGAAAVLLLALPGSAIAGSGGIGGPEGKQPRSERKRSASPRGGARKRSARERRAARRRAARRQKRRKQRQQAQQRVSFPVRATGETVFFDGVAPAAFNFVANRPGQIVVEVVDVVMNRVVKSTIRGATVDGEPHTVVWSGLDGRRAAPESVYRFRIADPAAATPGGPGSAAEGGDGSTGGAGFSSRGRASQVAEESFEFRHHLFPVRAPHDYGGASARFGAGRSGHSHQGHDVFAKCGASMKAAQGGKVIFKGFHPAAGYYLVIRGRNSAEDYVYMHLRGPATVRKNERVRTGQTIGENGESGNARGCHLHFELWSEPGWYNGGRPYDPLPSLEYWDSYS